MFRFVVVFPRESKWSKYMFGFEPKALVFWEKKRPGLDYSIIKWYPNKYNLIPKTKNQYIDDGWICVLLKTGLYRECYWALNKVLNYHLKYRSSQKRKANVDSEILDDDSLKVKINTLN